jgi:hypothetical protein
MRTPALRAPRCLFVLLVMPATHSTARACAGEGSSAALAVDTARELLSVPLMTDARKPPVPRALAALALALLLSPAATAAAEERPSAAPPEPTVDTEHAAGHVLVSLSFLGLTATGLLAVAAVDAQQDADDLEPFAAVGPEDERRYREAEDRHRAMSIAAVATGVGAGGLATLGVVLLMVTEPPAPERPSAVAWRPLVGVDVVGLDVVGHF